LSPISLCVETICLILIIFLCLCVYKFLCLQGSCLNYCTAIHVPCLMYPTENFHTLPIHKGIIVSPTLRAVVLYNSVNARTVRVAFQVECQFELFPSVSAHFSTHFSTPIWNKIPMPHEAPCVWFSSIPLRGRRFSVCSSTTVQATIWKVLLTGQLWWPASSGWCCWQLTVFLG